MGMLSAFAGPPQRQVSVLYRAPERALVGALPAGLRPIEREGWVLLELACAAPIELPLSDVALVAWRTPVRLDDGSNGLWVLERWTSARLGLGWPERWNQPRSTIRPPRHAQWTEADGGEFVVDVRSGARRVGLRATLAPKPERSLFLSTRQAESFLSDCGRVVNPHPLSWLIDRSSLASGQAGLAPLTVHGLEVSAPDGLVLRDALELDCAFRVVDRRHSPVEDRARTRAATASGLAAPAFSLQHPPHA